MIFVIYESYVSVSKSSYLIILKMISKRRARISQYNNKVVHVTSVRHHNVALALNVAWPKWAIFRSGLHSGTCLGLRLGQATFRARATFRCRTRVRLARSNWNLLKHIRFCTLAYRFHFSSSSLCIIWPSSILRCCSLSPCTIIRRADLSSEDRY